MNWLSQGLAKAHENLLRQPRTIYIGAIVVNPRRVSVLAAAAMGSLTLMPLRFPPASLTSPLSHPRSPPLGLREHFAAGAGAAPGPPTGALVRCVGRLGVNAALNRSFAE